MCPERYFGTAEAFELSDNQIWIAEIEDVSLIYDYTVNDTSHDSDAALFYNYFLIFDLSKSMSNQIDSSSSKKRGIQKLRASDLESKFQSKRALYQYLTVQW